MNAHCIFCKVVSGEIPAPKFYEDEDFIAIKDIHPQALIHLLILPKKHIASLTELLPTQELFVGQMMTAGMKAAEQNGLNDGFRSVINTGAGGGQTVFHLHLHILGGDKISDSFG